MFDFARLQAAISALQALAVKIQADVANLNARIEALEAQVDPTAQQTINGLADHAEQVAAALQAVDDLTPEIPVPPPPA